MDEQSSSSIVAPQQDIVKDLIAKTFVTRTDSEQDEILQNGRPMPVLRVTSGNRSFQEHWYARKEWLCGSESLQKLFCWPCILFSPGTSRSWTLNGYANMHGFLSDCKKHEKSQSHVSAVEKYNCRIIEILELRFSIANSEEGEQHSDQVSQNREITLTSEKNLCLIDHSCGLLPMLPK